MQRCSDEHHAALKQFAFTMCRFYAAAEDPDFPIDGDLARQIFETHMHTCSGVTGNRWKDWLLARVELHDDDPLNLLESGAAVCIRTATRLFVGVEANAKMRRRGFRPVSKDRPLKPDDPESATMENVGLLIESSDPALLAVWNNVRASVLKDARQIFGGMNSRQKVAVAAWALEISRADPAVTKAADCGRQAVFDAWHAVHADATRLAEEHAANDAETTGAYAELLMDDIGDLCVAWAKTEKTCKALFQK